MITIWFLRAAWITLPVTAGPAAADALQPWSTAPRVTAEVLLWLLWAVVVVATLAPRPVSLTAVRTGAPLALATAVLTFATGRPSPLAVVVAITATLAGVVLAALPAFARACAQGAAYGDEERFPLKVPPVLLLGILPLAVLAVAAGLASGPLLLAAGRIAAGTAAVVVGLPIAAVLLRSLHLLSRRWAVLVPAGLVIADPMTLADPVLFVREHVVGLGPADPTRRAPPDASDLRLGAAIGSLALLLDEDLDLSRRRGRGRERYRGHLILFTPVKSRVLLDRAAARRLPIQRSATKSTNTG